MSSRGICGRVITFRVSSAPSNARPSSASAVELCVGSSSSGPSSSSPSSSSSLASSPLLRRFRFDELAPARPLLVGGALALRGGLRSGCTASSSARSCSVGSWATCQGGARRVEGAQVAPHTAGHACLLWAQRADFDRDGLHRAARGGCRAFPLVQPLVQQQLLQPLVRLAVSDRGNRCCLALARGPRSSRSRRLPGRLGRRRRARGCGARSRAVLRRPGWRGLDRAAPSSAGGRRVGSPRGRAVGHARLLRRRPVRHAGLLGCLALRGADVLLQHLLLLVAIVVVDGHRAVLVEVLDDAWVPARASPKAGVHALADLERDQGRRRGAGGAS